MLKGKKVAIFSKDHNAIMLRVRQIQEECFLGLLDLEVGGTLYL